MPSALPVNGSERRPEPRSSDLQIALNAIEAVGTRHDAQLRDVATAIREDRKDNAVLLDKVISLSVMLNKQNTYLIVSIVGFVLTSLLMMFGYAVNVDLPFVSFGSP